MSRSLHGRILVAATVVLVAFLSLTALALDQAFRNSAEAGVRDRLQAHLYGLLAAAELGPDGEMSLPPALPEGRFSIPGSGLFAWIVDAEGELVWRSMSLLGLALPRERPLPPGTSDFGTGGGEHAWFVLHFGTVWETAEEEVHSFTFAVAEDRSALAGQVSAFRRSLAGWLGGAALVLLAVQGSILRWGLAPLRRVREGLDAMESGNADRIAGEYPRELAGLVEHINAFVRNERRHLKRYRDTLGDLAHSLKTPLAVLRGEVESGTPGDALKRTVGEQVDRMQGIVDYQLRRAATSGPTTLMAPVDVGVVASKIVKSLERVYRERAIAAEVEIAPGLRFHGDEGDLYEVLGNLLDNAFKWSAGRVRLRAVPMIAEGRRRSGLELVVEDDGPGIAPARVDEVTGRGVRADESMAGHGIGLAVIHDLVTSYEGQLEIGSGGLGGARVTVRLPAGA